MTRTMNYRPTRKFDTSALIPVGKLESFTKSIHVFLVRTSSLCIEWKIDEVNGHVSTPKRNNTLKAGLHFDPDNSGL